MKHIVSILLLFVTLNTFSQSIGIKVGGIFSYMNAPYYGDKRPLVKGIYGLVYTQEIGRFRVFIEPSYSVKGMAEKITFTDSNGNPIYNGKFQSEFGYVEIPILVGYNIIDKDLIFGVSLGAAPELLINTRQRTGTLKSSISNTNLFGMDLIGGAYVGYNLSDNLNFLINFRYGKGVVSPVEKSDYTYSYFSPFATVNYKF